VRSTPFAGIIRRGPPGIVAQSLEATTFPTLTGNRKAPLPQQFIDRRLRRVDSKGNGTVVAGSNTAGFSGDGGPASAALLNNPEGLALDSAGNLYIADTYNNRIREISAAVSIPWRQRRDLRESVQPRRASPEMEDQPLPPPCPSLYGVAVDSAGNILIADSNNDVIRKVTKGTINTVAGTGTKRGYSGDGGLATAALWTWPLGVAADAFGETFSSPIPRIT